MKPYLNVVIMVIVVVKEDQRLVLNLRENLKKERT